jgi:hypothetical protein
MVDSGDLAEANKEKKGMEKMAKTEPLAIQKFAQQATQQVDQDLKQEEKVERDRMRAKRKADLGATAQKQKGAKSALEKKREDVANKINGIHQAAQDKVKKRLADLETQSMKRFDDGNAKATKEFEDNVALELDAFKEDRYSGWFGWARRARDWIKGIDDLPAVKGIFDRNRGIFVRTIDKLVSDITADNKRVIQECKDELVNAKQKVKEFVDSLEPALKGIGKKAAGEMDAKLEELDKFVAKKEQELQDKLQDKQTAAIKAIDEKIEKMKEAMSGALAKLGRLVLWAAKKFFSWALEKFGFSLSDIESIINKGVAVLKAIFTKPIVFVKSLVRAAIEGFDNFRKRFLTHLQDAVFEWLTGSLKGIQLPSSWDPKGIASVALQLIPISGAHIRAKLVGLIGEPAVASLIGTFTLVKTLITEGPMAAWEQLKDMAGEIKKAFVDAVKEWIRNTIIFKAVAMILALFVPGAGIIRAIIGIYDTIVFFIKRAKDIIQMVGNFLGSISEIAAGNIGAAAAALEKGLARGLLLVIDFLARFLRLSGITGMIKKAIQKIRDKVDDAIDKVAKWVVEKAKKLGHMVAGAARRVVQWWRRRREFRNRSGISHTLSLEPRGRSSELVLQSNPEILSEYIRNLPPTLRGSQVVLSIQTKIGQINALKGPDGNFSENDGTKITLLFDAIVSLLAQIADSQTPSPPPPTVVKWDQTQSSTVEWPTRKTESLSTSMIADPLTINPGGNVGFIPREERKLWLSVKRRGDYAYVRGHLLSHHLFGPGVNKNLVPITGSLNGWMEKNIESKVKQKVLDQKKMVRFEVTVQYGQKGRLGLPDESLLPSRFSFSLNEYTHNGTNWVRNNTELFPVRTKTHDLNADSPLDVDAHNLAIWQARVSQPATAFRPYNSRDIYNLGDLIDHSKFGRGFVARLSPPNKMFVTFRKQPTPAVASPIGSEDKLLVYGVK